MSWSVSASGTTSALTLGSETTLTTDSTHNATFVFQFNTSNLALGDILRPGIYTNTLSSGSRTQTWTATFANVQTENEKVSPFVASDQSIQVTLKQTSGTISISSVTGTIPDSSIVTGLTSGATAIVHPPGGGNVSGSSTVVQMLSGTFTNGETIQLSAGNSFVLAAAPTGRTFDWKLLYQ